MLVSLLDYLKMARHEAVITRMDSHFISEIEHLMSTVIANMEK